MAAIISRRLSSKLLKPFYSSSLSLFYTNNLIFHNPQGPIFEPFSHFNPHHSFSPFTSSHSSQSTPSNSSAKAIFYSAIDSFNRVSAEKPRKFSLPHSPVSSQNSPQCPDLKQNQRLFVISMNPFITSSSVVRPRFFSTNDSSSKPEKPQNPNLNPSQNPYLKHHEIEGPDPSSVANETREVLERMVKNMYNLNKALSVVSVLQLGFGAWIFYITQTSPITEVSMQSLLAFALPLSMAFLLRQSLKSKPMHFFNKIEDQGGDFSSSLAKESREVRKWMIKFAKPLIIAVSVSNLVQLGLGAWITEITWSSPIWEVTMQSFLAFAFPISLLFVMNQSFNPKYSNNKKMEEQSKTLQFARQLDVFLVRSRVVSFICIAGLSAGLSAPLVFAVISR